MNDALVALTLCFVAAGGTAVVATREPARQAVAMSFAGLLLVIAFVELQAPDVALSELVVGTIAVPAMTLLALARTAAYAQRHAAEAPREEGGAEDEPDDDEVAARGGRRRGSGRA